MQATSRSRTIEITIFSCEDLSIDRKSIKKNTYVVVRTDCLNSHTTKIDTEGGSYPCWNEKLIIDIPLNERFITLEACYKTTSSTTTDRIIATARMPVTDFMGGYLPNNYLNILSYRLRDARGERNGIINLSVKVKEVEAEAVADYYYLSKQLYDKAGSTGYAITNDGHKNFGFVTGIPVPVSGASHI